MKKEETELQYGANSRIINPAKFYILSVVFALPTITAAVFAYILRGGKLYQLIINLVIYAGLGMMMSLAFTYFVNMKRFLKSDPSYKNYYSKNRADWANVAFFAFCGIYIAFLAGLIFSEKTISEIWSFMTPLCIFPMVSIMSNFVVLMSDENLYIGTYQESIPIDKIRIDDFDKLDNSMKLYEEYIFLEFHYNEKAYKTTLSRRILVELCKVLPGVNRDYSRTPNSRKSPQKFYD